MNSFALALYEMTVELFSVSVPLKRCTLLYCNKYKYIEIIYQHFLLHIVIVLFPGDVFFCDCHFAHLLNTEYLVNTVRCYGYR
jgi:hypothetical protein